MFLKKRMLSGDSADHLTELKKKKFVIFLSIYKLVNVVLILQYGKTGIFIQVYTDNLILAHVRSVVSVLGNLWWEVWIIEMFAEVQMWNDEEVTVD